MQTIMLPWFDSLNLQTFDDLPKWKNLLSRFELDSPESRFASCSLELVGGIHDQVTTDPLEEGPLIRKLT
jgi:hypothetical protein